MQNERYSRQQRFAAIGIEGQQKIIDSSVAIIGCGALGTLACEILARAGVGHIRLIDRDFVEYSNLQRQSLFTEADAEQRIPKVIAAQHAIAAINSDVEIDAHIADLHAGNVADLLSSVDLIIDACDNFITRHIVNDFACSVGCPWIYAACVGSYACGMNIIPGQTPCLSCIQDELPAAGDSPSCDSGGIIAPAVYAAASRQIAEALKILSGNSEACDKHFWSTDVWQAETRSMDLSKWKYDKCESCGENATHPYLNKSRDVSVQLCGRNGLQITLAQEVDLQKIQTLVGDHFEVGNEYLIRWQTDGITATCFRDGRVIVQGTQEESVARTFIDRWLG
ncbi:MAG: ThiF family adenylyltransferase [Planctomycetes bacterium]|nr:ThiF family adenylyltransferase [Planctomycetota bacterium]